MSLKCHCFGSGARPEVSRTGSWEDGQEVEDTKDNLEPPRYTRTLSFPFASDLREVCDL